MDRAESTEKTGMIIHAAMKLHTALGPGLLEGAYRAIVTHALRRAGLGVRTEVAVPLVYEGVSLDHAFRIDLVVEDEIIVEVKAVQALLPVHKSQVLTYLRLSGRRVGLLINFNESHLKDGIARVVNNW